MTESAYSYLCFGCVELVNHARTAKYLRWAASQGAWADMRCCPEMLSECWCPADGDLSDFSDPITDGACWIDELVPESPEFLGLYVRSIDGVNDSAYARAATGNVGDGVTLGRSATGGKTFTVHGIILATSCAGADYGMEYVSRVLEQGGCGAGTCLGGCGDLGACGTTCMTLRVNCPDPDLDVDNGLRQWVNAGLSDGLKEATDDASEACRCCWREVVFTITAETRRAFAVDPVVCIDKDADLENTATRCFNWLGCEDLFPPDDCTTDPVCDNPVCDLPRAPQRVRTCFCEPMGVSIDCCCASDAANNRDETFRVVLDAGKNPADGAFTAKGLRNCRVKFYTADPRRPCPSDSAIAAKGYGEAQECARLDIPYLKPGAQLVIDGRSDRITVQCDAKCYPGWNAVYGPNGSSPFPLLSSCRGIFVCVEWDLGNTQFVDDIGAGAVRSHVRVERFRVYG